MATYSSVRNGRGRGHRRGESRRPGQWKLAYADFLTALMAFFLLMWLSTGSSEAERSAIAAYFSGEEVAGNTLQSDMIKTDLEAIFAIEIAANPALSRLREHIRLHSEPEGLRIDLTDASSDILFASGSAELSQTGENLIANIGAILVSLPLDLKIEGHTDAFKTALGAPNNWDISSARAASALKALQKAGVEENRFKTVTGMAATQPLLPNQPHAAVNRRISIMLELSDRRALSR